MAPISTSRSDQSVGLRRALALAVLCVAPLASGCYAYTLVEHAPVGSLARVRIPVQPVVVAPGQPPETVAIEGRILSAGDTLSLETNTRRFIGAFRELMGRDTLRVARGAVASIEVREFSAVRSVALGAAVAAGTAALALAARDTEGGRAGEGPGGGGSESFFTAVGIPLGAALRLFGR